MRILGIDPGLALMGYGVIDYTGGKYTLLAAIQSTMEGCDEEA